MRLNRRQRMAVKVGVAVVILMGLFPPVVSNVTVRGALHSIGYKRSYRFLLQPYRRMRFDYLGKQWAVVAAATVGTVFFLKDKDDESKEPPSEV